MIKRFNGRISKLLAIHRFESRQDLEATLLRYVLLYNQHLPQRMLAHQPPLLAMKQWQKSYPELFKKQGRNRPGLDI